MFKSIPSQPNENPRYNPAVSIKPSIVVFSAVVFLSTACGAPIRKEMISTATAAPVTSTFPVTLTQVPSETPLPPPPAPTVAPVEGTTSTQINVRAEPSTASNVLGMIPPNTKVEIIGKDLGENWWQIHYPQGPNGKGWVTAQYITTATKPDVPTIGGGQANPSNGISAVVQQQLNVRSGPGTDFNSLGTLNEQDVVQLTGKDPNGAWLQIEFAAGPEGRGWVNAAFVQANGVENLPIITEAGLIVGTGTPAIVPATSTSTVIPAWIDNDSPDAPIVSVVFEPAGTQTLIYNGEVSSSQGDSEDWVAFKPYGRFVFISLECHGDNSIRTDMSENSLSMNTYIRCGDQMRKTTVNAGSNYLLHLQAAPSAGDLQYTNYILTIKVRP